MINKKFKDELKRIETTSSSLSEKIKSTRDSAFTKFPLVFVLLSSFGLVATFYGFEKVIDEIPLFTESPYLILITGIITLLMTGALYKKLS
jgi:hypothetical protein